MNQTKLSSSDTTMAMAIAQATSRTFDHLLEQVKNSNLNFHLQQSPFTAIISLKKSPIKDVNGFHVMPTIPVSTVSEQKLLNSKILVLDKKLQELENTNATLQCLYEQAVHDAEEAHIAKSNLENQLEIVRNQASSDKLENIKCELKSVTSKFEKSRHDLSEIKNENDALKRTTNAQSTQLKAARKDVKDIERVKNIEIKNLHSELRKMNEFKEKYDREQIQLKKKLKKESKKKKKETEREAKEILKRRNENEVTAEDAACIPALKTADKTQLEPCTHNPQCILRDPKPPPFGPKTLAEFQMEEDIVKQESIEGFINYVKDFIKKEDGETFDDQIEKLEALKRLLEPQEPADSVFDDLIEKIKTVKEAVNNLSRNDEEEVSWSDYYDDEIPEHYWGGEDGNELIFLDNDKELTGSVPLL